MDNQTVGAPKSNKGGRRAGAGRPRKPVIVHVVYRTGESDEFDILQVAATAEVGKALAERDAESGTYGAWEDEWAPSPYEDSIGLSRCAQRARYHVQPFQLQ